MKGAKILVVDDDVKITTLVEFLLRKEGFLTVVAHSGEEALRLVELESPDLIILDLMMPGMDGYQVCETVKTSEKTKKIPVIMLTALGMGKDFERGLEKGADWYITKPFDNHHLMKRVRYLTEKKEKK